MKQLYHSLFHSCSGLPLVGLVLIAVAGVMFLAGRRKQSQKRKLTIASALLAVIGVVLVVTGPIAVKGTCEEVDGNCPAPLTGTAYVCVHEGADCKSWGLFSGKCTTVAGWIFDCKCDCQ
jgi:hypothetical protein